MILKIVGKKEEIRADFVDKILLYFEKSLSSLLWGENRRKRLHFVIREVKKGSLLYDMQAVAKQKKGYVDIDLEKELKDRVITPETLFEMEDPAYLIDIFEDEYGIEQTGFSINGKSIEFRLEEIRKYENKFFKAYGTVAGIVISIRALDLEGETVEARIKWSVNPDKSIRLIVNNEDLKVKLLQNFQKPVLVRGLIYYDKNDLPVRINPVLEIEPLEKIQPDLDNLVGIIELDEDSVSLIRRMRKEWNDEE